MLRITKVHVLPGYRLELTFDDGASGTVDLFDMIGKGVFALWRDRGTFESVQIGPSGELAWSDRVDLCPDSLYLSLREFPAWEGGSESREPRSGSGEARTR